MISKKFKLKLLDRQTADLLQIQDLIQEELNTRENQELDTIEKGLI